MQIELTQLPFEDSSFDVVFCRHVLERSPDDREPLREDTFEDPPTVDPADRKRVYGESGNVRSDARDLPDRASRAAFQAEAILLRMGLEAIATRRFERRREDESCGCTRSVAGR